MIPAIDLRFVTYKGKSTKLEESPQRKEKKTAKIYVGKLVTSI